MRVLVDTNVFLDIFLNRDNGESKKFFWWCSLNKCEICLAAISLRDIEYVAHHILHNKEESKKIQKAAYLACKNIIGISSEAAIRSLDSPIGDYEDALILEAAKEGKCDAIVTNNYKDFEKAGFPVYAPKDIVHLVEL